MGALIFSENAPKFLAGTLPMVASIPISPLQENGPWPPFLSNCGQHARHNGCTVFTTDDVAVAPRNQTPNNY